YDFYFQNKNDVPIELTLESKSCKCARVEMTTLTSEEDQEFKNLPRYEAAQLLAPAINPLTGMAMNWMFAKRLGFVLNGERWKTVEDYRTGTPLVVPPQSTGFVRVGWDGKVKGNQWLKAALLTNAKGSDARATATLEVAVFFTPTLTLNSSTLDLSPPIR